MIKLEAQHLSIFFDLSGLGNGICLVFSPEIVLSQPLGETIRSSSLNEHHIDPVVFGGSQVPIEHRFFKFKCV